jgi:hypothetical protein
MLESVQLFRGGHRLDLANAMVAQILTSTFASLTFDNQKNGVRGEVIGLSPSGDCLLCPNRAIARQVLHLRQHNAPPATPLHSYYLPRGRQCVVKPPDITSTLCLAIRFLGPALGFLPEDVTAHCHRAAGANALLCAGVDTDVIRLSDKMLCYLHTQAIPVMHDFARKMLAGGNFTLIPYQTAPTF